MKAFISIGTLVVVCLSLSGCLKSRFQLRDDPSDQETARPIQAQVQEVQPAAGHIVDELRTEITRLNGRLEEMERAKQEAAKTATPKEDVKKLESRIIELEQAQIKLIEALQKVRAATPTQQANAVVDSHELFSKGMAQFEESHCDQAIESFSEYLKLPKNNRAEDATFYRAECYFKLKQYKKAIVDYSRLPEKFTHSKHMPVALLKIGGSFEALGMKEDAKGFYQELIEKFPKTAEAKRARMKMK